MSDEFVPEYPKEIMLADLEATHAEYNCLCPLTNIGLLEKHDDLHHGGYRFRKNVDHYLVKRAIEGGSNTGKLANQPGVNPKSEGNVLASTATALQGSGKGNAGATQWAARKRRSYYTPPASGIIDFMVSAILQNIPKIVAGLVENATDDVMNYWNDFNENADGKGADLASIARNAMLEVMLHKRAYFAVRFPKSSATNVGEQESKGELDGRMCLWDARFVDDWELDEDGNHVMLRTHSKQNTRSEKWKQPDTERHCWRYITKLAIYEYEITYLKDKKPDPEKTPVALKSTTRNTTGLMPVVPIVINDGLWVMDRLADTILAIFNRQSGTNWSLDQMSFAILVIKSGKSIGDLTCDDIVALLVEQGDDVKFEAPNPAIITALIADIERLKTELLSCIRMMIMEAMKDKGGNPASGSAKEIDIAGMSTLLEAFGAPLKDAIEAIVKIIQTIRGEIDADGNNNFPLMVHGLDKYDVQSVEKKIEIVAAYMGLPGLPESAKKWAITDTSLAMTANAPAEVRKSVIEEMKAMKEIPSLVPVAPVGANKKQIPLETSGADMVA